MNQATAQAYVQKMSDNIHQRNANALRRRAVAEKDIHKLKKQHKPVLFAYIGLGLVGLAIDCIDIFNVPIDATVIGFIIMIIINIGFFFTVRAFLNRSGIMQFCMLGLIGLSMIMTLTFVLAAFAWVPMIPIVILGAFNRNGIVIEKGKDHVMSHIKELERIIVTLRQRTAQLLRAGRKIPRLSKATYYVAKKIRTITRLSKTTKRALATSGANIIPIIGMIPFQLWTVYETYKDQKKAYQEAQDLIAEYVQKTKEEQQLREIADLGEAETLITAIQKTEEQPARPPNPVQVFDVTRPTVMAMT